jgi:hypothetical protein
MSPTRAARIQRGVSWVFMVIATAAIFVGYLRLDQNQSDIQAASARADHNICVAFNEMRDSLKATFEFSTQPVDTSKSTGDVLAAQLRANELRVKARQDLLALLPPERKC